MRLLSQSTRAATAVLAGAMLLAACGSDSTTTEPSGSDTTAAEETPSETEPSEPPAGSGNGTLTIGTLLPQTGDLAFLGPPEFAGVDLAVQDINDAGGVLGADVEQVKGDSGDGTPNIAPRETTTLLARDADVIIGAASSSVSLSVIDKITGAGVVQISPANTSTAFDTYDDKGLYFRTAPSDVLQGAVMANLVTEDKFSNIAIMARQDSYGEALADQVEQRFTDAGGNVVAKELYDANASNFGAEVQKIAAQDPDAIVLIAFAETTNIIPELIANNIGPQDLQVYFVDGNTADYSGEFDEGTLEGVRATYPGAELTGDFRQRLLEADPKLKEFTYGPESYDATIVAALAATAAGDDSGESIASKLQEVSVGGTECTEYQECVTMIEAGEDIDYNGVSGPIDFNDTGSPSAATIGIFEYEADNAFPPSVEFVTGKI
ncbi:MAG: ABC transporter substrate-binding protein [Actinomycetota bacterium]|nr:ABC transporter substrate-binding protein [Actinomycetota bacterium]